jgi:hypothetical protein
MLGRAYSSDEERLRKEHVWACCNKSEGMPETSMGPCALGVDNSDHKHVTILQRTGNDRYQMVRIFEFESDTDYARTLDLIRKFNIKTGVVDLRPNADSAKEFRKAALRLGCRVWLCEYTDSPLQDAAYNDQTGIVKVYRTGMFDRTHRIIQGQNIVLPRRSKLIDQFAEECCNTVKSKEIDKRTRNIVYRYKKTGSGKDDFRNSLNYAVLAANKVPRAKAGRWVRWVSSRWTAI